MAAAVSCLGADGFQWTVSTGASETISSVRQGRRLGGGGGGGGGGCGGCGRSPPSSISKPPSGIFLSNFQGRAFKILDFFLKQILDLLKKWWTFQYAARFRGPGILIKRSTIVDLSV